MSFHFDKDYLQDLEPVLTELRNDGRSNVVDVINECKATGSTGGEILSCINFNLRKVLDEYPAKSLKDAITNYLRKAPGY